MTFHVDGNSFYAACERLFRPDLGGKAIAVLTNNDGIIIALNQECKDLGYRRGDVYFKIRDRLKADGVAVFSSNYTLYADISARLNLLYNDFAPDVEFYSIDESFLFFPDWDTDYTAIGTAIREAAAREIGIPVSVGIAPNKTLAKLCNKLAKKQGGVCDWSRLDQDKTLAQYPAGDVWGIGWSKAKFLSGQGIKSALDLKRYPLDKAKKNLTISGCRTVQELNGIRAIGETADAERQSIIVSKSFSGAVFDFPTTSGALAMHVQEAVNRMRGEKLACAYIGVYARANERDGQPRYSNYAQAKLTTPTSYYPEILQTALALLRRIFRQGYAYRKTMIVLSGLVKESDVQNELFGDSARQEKHEKLMKTFDEINERWGKGAIRLGTSALAKKAGNGGFAPWEMKRELLSPAYTTSLADVPAVY